MTAQQPGPAGISLEDVRRVARLGRLHLSDAEAERMKSQLDSILGYVASLDVLDVASVQPTFHAVPMLSPLREDLVRASLPREEALMAAPGTDAGAFAVPKVMEGDS